MAAVALLGACPPWELSEAPPSLAGVAVASYPQDYEFLVGPPTGVERLAEQVEALAGHGWRVDSVEAVGGSPGRYIVTYARRRGP